MFLFVSEVSGAYEQGYSGSQLAGALLRYAYERVWGESCPELDRRPGGKPYFHDRTNRHLSLSHSKRHVLVALSEKEVGADIESSGRRERSTRLFSQRMLDDFGYLGAWTLRESVFKLRGEGSLRNMDIGRQGERISTPYDGICCRIYENIPGCVISAAGYEDDFPVKPEIIDISEFL